MTSSPRRAGFRGDSRILGGAAIVFAFAVAAASFAISYTGLAEVGRQLGLGVHAYLVAVAWDGGILTAGLLAAVKRAQRRPAALELATLWVATIVSSLANGAVHVARNDGMIAAVMGGLAPWLFLVVTESIIRTLSQDEVAPAPRKRAAKPVSIQAASVTAEPPAVVTPRPAPAPRTLEAPAIPEGDVEALFETVGAIRGNLRPGSPESQAVTDAALALSAHKIGARAIARRLTDDDGEQVRIEARIKDRLKKARQRAVAAV